MASKAVILMAEYGNDPTEVAVPFTIWTEAGMEVAIATEHGAVPGCDRKMYSGWTQKTLGANNEAVAKHASMIATKQYQNPLAWTKAGFSLADYDLVFLPGGHDKGMQHIIQSPSLHSLLAEFVPQTKRSDPARKSLAAICHGVQVLAAAPSASDESKSVIHDFETTALPGTMEQGIFWATRAFLGDYYKTFGAGTDSVETIVRRRLDNPGKQYKSSLSGAPFVHEDPHYNYVSGRFPPDAHLLAIKAMKLLRQTS